MALYPVNLCIEGRSCLVVGGGAVAERKALALLAAGARVTVLSPRVTLLLTEMVQTGRVQHIAKPYHPEAIEKYFIVICATDDAVINREAAACARRAGALVNVVDAPEISDFNVPAQIARGDLLLTVSTNGKSPALARRLREELETQYGPEYGLYLELVSRLRTEVKQQLPTAGKREDFWRQTLSGEILALLRAGRVNEAEEKIKDAAHGLRTQS